MSCDCSGCQRSKRIGEIRAKQPEGNRSEKLRKNTVKKNPVSRKILMDRYLSARRWLLLQIKWYRESYERRKKSPPKANAKYVDFFHGPIKRNTWGVKKYNEARAECKARHLLP